MKKLIRKQFREEVFARDKHRCRCCGVQGTDRQNPDPKIKIFLDAHHIEDRHKFINGGYLLANGITVCDECHAKAEQYHSSGETSWEPGFHPDDLYKLIGSSFELALKADAKLK
jgi:hypothetical protein